MVLKTISESSVSFFYEFTKQIFVKCHFAQGALPCKQNTQSPCTRGTYTLWEETINKQTCKYIYNISGVAEN